MKDLQRLNKHLIKTGNDISWEQTQCLQGETRKKGVMAEGLNIQRPCNRANERQRRYGANPYYVKCMDS